MQLELANNNLVQNLQHVYDFTSSVGRIVCFLTTVRFWRTVRFQRTLRFVVRLEKQSETLSQRLRSENKRTLYQNATESCCFWRQLYHSLMFWEVTNNLGTVDQGTLELSVQQFGRCNFWPLTYLDVSSISNKLVSKVSAQKKGEKSYDSYKYLFKFR